MCCHRRLALTLSLFGFFAAPALPTLAQGAPVTVTAPSAPTLAAALAAAIPPTQGVVLTVDAAKVKLPKDVAVPGVALSITDTASLYGQIARMYGDVTAIAPSTMTVVYAPPETPNPYDGMPPGQVLKLLTSSFDVNQWKTFMGQAGIGLADLTSDTQKQLFMAFFPDGHLKIIKDNPTGPNDPKTRQDIFGDALTQARLKIFYLVSIALPVPDQPDGHVFAMTLDVADAPARYMMTNSQGGDVDHEYGAIVRETLSNTSKPSELKSDSLIEKAQVPLDGIKTVDDLIAHIDAAAHLELYADARYGRRAVTLLGSAKTASASDLLRALALCVHGTYRQVGPAYVLTDDLLGAGTRHALWKEFEDKAHTMLPGNSVFASPQQNPAHYTMRDIGWGGDPLAFTPDQQKSYWDKRADEFAGDDMMDITLPFDQLTSAQQEAAQKTLAWDQAHKVDASLDGTIMLQAEMEVAVTLPSLDGSIMVFGPYRGILPSLPPPTAAQAAKRQQRMEAMFPETIRSSKPVTLAAVKASIAQYPRRAARIALKANDDISATFAALQKLGFNEAWLDIPVSADSQDDPAVAALVAKAVKVGKKDGIAVYPDIRLLDWGKDAPADLLDRDIVNRTATEGAKAQLFPGLPAYDTVTPFAPEVVKRLTALAAAIGAVKGIGGMVWDDLIPPGYKPLDPHGANNDFEDPLGYATAGRLANLREYHADPIDLYTNRSTDERANVQIPGFTDNFQEERTLYENWQRLRASAVQGMTHWLIAALPQAFLADSPNRLPLIVQPSNGISSFRYGSWDNLMQPQPTETFDSPKDAYGQPIPESPSIERLAGKQQYTKIWVGAPKSASAKAWADAAARSLAAPLSSKPAQGLLLDASEVPGGVEALTKIGD